jgi:7-cyano-7-deazaguanine reductase
MPAKITGLTMLGRKTRRPSKKLEAFPNKYPRRDYRVVLETSEFTALCPITGQPDFGAITISYVPDQLVVESKSLKLYLWSFRQEGHFHEEVVNRILDDLVRAIKPRRMQVKGEFKARGGIAITVTAEYPNQQ